MLLFSFWYSCYISPFIISLIYPIIFLITSMSIEIILSSNSPIHYPSSWPLLLILTTTLIPITILNLNHYINPIHYINLTLSPIFISLNKSLFSFDNRKSSTNSILNIQSTSSLLKSFKIFHLHPTSIHLIINWLSNLRLSQFLHPTLLIWFPIPNTGPSSEI